VNRSIFALLLVCACATVAQAQEAEPAPEPATPPAPAPEAPPPTPATPPAPAPEAPPPTPATPPPPPATPVTPGPATPLPPKVEAIIAEDATTAAGWRSSYHFDLHWRVLMLPERAIELAFLPITLFVGAVEEYRLDKRLGALLTFRDDRIKISPRFKFSLGDGAGIGLWIKRQKLFDRRAELRAGGIIRRDLDWQQEVEYKHRLLLPGGRGLRARAFVEDDKNQRYFGIGGDTVLTDRRVMRAFEEGGSVEIDLQGVDRYTYSGTARLGVLRQELTAGTSITYPPVGEPGDSVMPPPAFDDTAVYADARLEGRYDTRDTFGRPTRGWIAEIDARARQEVTGKDLSGITLHSMVRWHIPVLPRNRVLVLSVAGTGSFSMLPGSSIPLESLAVIDRGNVRGYDRERFRDRYALVGSVEYRFPIYEYLASRAGLDAFTFVDTGTIWGFSKFNSSPLWSVGGGVRGAHDTTVVFESTIGYSPEGFEITIGAESSL
jgi:hypothetical protein